MTDLTPQNFLFAGPSLTGLDPAFVEGLPLTVLPPARRGDIDALVERQRPPGQIVLADGLLGQGVAVEPDEIRRAAAAGWVVWGIASTGALLAARMKDLAIRGFGHVFRSYLLDEGLDADSIALVHEAAPPFAPLSEPLIHQRLLIEHLVAEGGISERRAHGVLEQVKRARLDERTVERLEGLLAEAGGLSAAAARDAVGQLPRFRVKQRDLRKFLQDHFADGQRE